MQEKGVSGQQMPRGGGQVPRAAATLPGLSRGDGLGLLDVFFWLWPHTATAQAPAGSPSHSGGGRDPPFSLKHPHHGVSRGQGFILASSNRAAGLLPLSGR